MQANQRPTTFLLIGWIAVMFVLAVTDHAVRPFTETTIKPHTTGYQINLNRADANTLSLLPGIGASLGQRIVAYRQTQGRFKHIDQLTQVNGIGPRTVDRFRAWATCDDWAQNKTDGNLSDRR